MLEDIEDISTNYHNPLLKCRVYKIKTKKLQRIANATDVRGLMKTHKKYHNHIKHWFKNHELHYGDIIIPISIPRLPHLIVNYYNQLQLIKDARVWHIHPTLGIAIPLNYWYPHIKEVVFAHQSFIPQLTANYKNDRSWFNLGRQKCWIIMTGEATNEYKRMRFIQLMMNKSINYIVRPYDQYIMKYFCPALI